MRRPRDVRVSTADDMRKLRSGPTAAAAARLPFLRRPCVWPCVCKLGPLLGSNCQPVCCRGKRGCCKSKLLALGSCPRAEMAKWESVRKRVAEGAPRLVLSKCEASGTW